MCLLPRRGLIWYLCNCLNYNMNTFFEKPKNKHVYWNAGWGGFLKFVDSIRIEYECDCLLLKDQECINNIYFFDRAQDSTESTALIIVPPPATLDKCHVMTIPWSWPWIWIWAFYSLRDRGGGRRDAHLSVIVPDRMRTTSKAAETPGLIIPSKQTDIAVSFPFDSPVTHWDINISFPNDLPVTMARPSLYSSWCQWNLSWCAGSLHMCQLPVVVREFEFSVYCVSIVKLWVDRNFKWMSEWEKTHMQEAEYELWEDGQQLQRAQSRRLQIQEEESFREKRIEKCSSTWRGGCSCNGRNEHCDIMVHKCTFLNPFQASKKYIV